MKKRIFSVLLVACLAFDLLPTAALAAGTAKICGDFTVTMTVPSRLMTAIP